jgi:hypothetical protein
VPDTIEGHLTAGKNAAGERDNTPDVYGLVTAIFVAPQRGATTGRILVIADASSNLLAAPGRVALILGHVGCSRRSCSGDFLAVEGPAFANRAPRPLCATDVFVRRKL